MGVALGRRGLIDSMGFSRAFNASQEGRYALNFPETHYDQIVSTKVAVS
jgi:hypothetical protein